MERKASLNLLGYFQGAGMVALATFLGLIAQPFLDRTGTVMLYLLAVVATAVLWGLWPSIAVSILSVMALDFFFVTPFMRFGPIDPKDLPTLVVMLVVGAEISYMASRVRQQTEEARRHERETYNLYVLSRSLASTDDLETSAFAIVKSAKETLGYDTTLFLPDGQNLTALRPYGESEKPVADENGVAIATWSFLNRRKAGRGTAMFPHARAEYVPLITARGTAGVMALNRPDLPEDLNAEKKLLTAIPDATSEYVRLASVSKTIGVATPGETDSSGVNTEQERLITAFLDLVAVATERLTLAQQTRNMEMFQAATKKLQTALLDSISHDLKTPLSSITGVLTSLQETPGLTDSVKMDLVKIASEEADRLNSSITNLLDMSRIEAGGLSVSKQPTEVGELINAALDEMGKRTGSRKVRVDVAAELPLVQADFALIVRVLDNLIDNAIKYSPAESPIEISARPYGHAVEIRVADRGVGIPPQELPHIFERFHRVPRTGVIGTGLGLSISKGIVEAHGGSISLDNRDGGGVIVKFTLPSAEPETPEEERGND